MKEECSLREMESGVRGGGSSIFFLPLCDGSSFALPSDEVERNRYER